MIKITIKLAVGTHGDSSGKSNSRKSRRKRSVLPRKLRVAHGKRSVCQRRQSHRLNTIQTADKIIMLEDGEIREQGSHDQLIQLRGKYYDLNKAQLQKETNV